MDKAQLLEFLQSHSLAVQSSVSPEFTPQAAVVGYAISSDFEFVLDTLEATRKVRNLRLNSEVALTIGGLSSGDERTVQCNGVADEPRGTELARLKDVYFAAIPQGRERESWPNLIYIRVRPAWIRYTDYGIDPPVSILYDFNAD